MIWLVAHVWFGSRENRHSKIFDCDMNGTKFQIFGIFVVRCDSEKGSFFQNNSCINTRVNANRGHSWEIFSTDRDFLKYLKYFFRDANLRRCCLLRSHQRVLYGAHYNLWSIDFGGSFNKHPFQFLFGGLVIF